MVKSKQLTDLKDKDALGVDPEHVFEKSPHVPRVEFVSFVNHDQEHINDADDNLQMESEEDEVSKEKNKNKNNKNKLKHANILEKTPPGHKTIEKRTVEKVDYLKRDGSVYNGDMIKQENS